MPRSGSRRTIAKTDQIRTKKRETIKYLNSYSISLYAT